ncbi:MAG TPA: histidine phosphatase family protein [Acetobacteraceae bacterium]|nr:histidine phosphatase family protein [Acetobacteraceae bacterium]
MILLRHGQSEFNLHFTATRRDPGIVDAKLTPLGHAQAEDAARSLAREHITRIITSPYTRALQTAAPLARALNVPVIVNPIVRERYAFACDIGTPRTELERCWPDRDFSGLDEVWWPPIEEPADAVEARAALFRAELAALPDWQQTVVVSHWGFILCLTGQSVMNGTWLRCDPKAPPPPRIMWRA